MMHDDNLSGNVPDVQPGVVPPAEQNTVQNTVQNNVQGTVQNATPIITQYPDDPQFSEEQLRAIEMAKNSSPANREIKTAQDPDSGFEHLAPPKRSPFKVVLIVLLCAILAGAGGFGGWYYWSTQIATFEYELKPTVILNWQSIEANAFLPDYETDRGITAEFQDPGFTPVPGRVIVPLTLRMGLRSLETDATLYVLTPISEKIHEYREEAPEPVPSDYLTDAGLARGVPYDIVFTEKPLALSEYEVGQHTLKLMLNGEPFEVMLTVVDTTAPTALPEAVVAQIGEEVTPEDFVTNVFDHSGIELISFLGDNAGEPFITAFADQIVEVEIFDIYGNFEQFRSSLTVLRNETPPMLMGVPHVVESMVDTPVKYPDTVFAYDDFGREIEYYVEDEEVDITTVDEYTVTYVAEDYSGLRTEIEVPLFIISVDPDEVNTWVDEKLQEIIENGMTEEEKVRAIFDLVRKTITPTTNKLSDEWTGSVYTAAHYAINNTSGNHHHFYALSEVMLTRAGVENMRIERSESVGIAHFWNLVYVDGAWYHYDALQATNWNAYNWMNAVQHMFTEAQAVRYSKQMADFPNFKKSGYYDYDKSLYPEVTAGEEE